jgi:hypothetical protein
MILPGMARDGDDHQGIPEAFFELEVEHEEESGDQDHPSPNAQEAGEETGRQSL